MPKRSPGEIPGFFLLPAIAPPATDFRFWYCPGGFGFMGLVTFDTRYRRCRRLR